MVIITTTANEKFKKEVQVIVPGIAGEEGHFKDIFETAKQIEG